MENPRPFSIDADMAGTSQWDRVAKSLRSKVKQTEDQGSAMADSSQQLVDLEALKLLWMRYAGPDAHTALYGTVAVLLVTLVVLVSAFVTSLRRKKSDTILLLGLSGSGKTALFYQLRDASIHTGTVTSMEPNEDRFALHSETSKNGKIKPVHVVDVPGHPRLRPLLDEYLPKAQGIVFVVDALDFVPSVRPTAEYLYEVLSRPVVVKRRIPVLIVCNKSDKVTAHSVDFIRKQLEKELDKLRGTRRSLSGSDSSGEVYLGTEGEPFKLSQCNNKVTITEASALTGNIGDVERFIREQVKP